MLVGIVVNNKGGLLNANRSHLAGYFRTNKIPEYSKMKKNKHNSQFQFMQIEQIIQSVNHSMHKKHYKQSAQLLLPSTKKKMAW